MERSFLRVIAPIVALIITAMGVTVWVDYKESSALVERTQERLQSMTCEEIANELTLRMEKTLEKIDIIANLPSLPLYLAMKKSDPGYPHRQSLLTSFLAHLHRQYSTFGTVLVVDKSGTILASSGGVEQKSLPAALMERLLREPSSMGVARLKGSGPPTPYAASRIMGDDGSLGLVVEFIQLEKYASAWNSRLVVSEKARLGIYDADNNLLLNVGNGGQLDDRLEAFRKSLLKGSEGVMTRTLFDTPRLVTFVTMPRTGWKVVMGSDYEAVMSPVTDKLQHSLLLNGVALLVVVLAVSFIILRKSQVIEQREQALLELNKELKNLSDNVPGGIFKLRLDDMYSIIYANDEFYRLIWCDPAQFSPEHPCSPLEFVPPDYLPACIDLMHQALEAGEHYEFRHPIIQPNGQENWMLVRGFFTPGNTDCGFQVMDGITLDITHSVRLEQELQKSRDRLELIIETCSVPLWILNVQEKTIYYNDHVVQLLGWEDDGFNACTIDSMRDRIHPDDQATHDAYLRALLTGKETSDVEFRVRHGDGHWHWLMAKGRMVLSPSLTNPSHEIMGTLLDTHVHKMAAQNVREQATVLEKLVAERTEQLNTERHLLRAMMDTIPDLFVYKDIQGLYRACNRAFLERFGIASEEEVIGKSNYEVFSYHPEAVAMFDMGDNRVLQSRGSVLLEYGLTVADNTRVEFETIKTLMLNEKGQRIGIVGISRDITARKRMETQLRESRREAEAASQAKSDFLANMSHEVRTPLNGVIGMNYLARQANPPADILDYLEKMDRSAQNLLAIVNDILDFSKIEAGKVELERTAFAPRTLMQALVDMFEPAAANKGIALRLECPANLPQTCLGDPLRLNQVLMNLMSNAVKFTQQGQITLRVRVVDHSPEGVRMAISVEDTGIGMTSAESAKLFSAFTQADTSITRRYGGTGLGLSISKGLVNLMNGELGVASEHGKGSTFTVTLTLPVLASEQPDSVAPAAQQEVAGPQQNLQGLRVLLVEDNDINQLIAQEILLQFGCTVELAENGQQAVDMARSKDFDLIFMDIQMPVMDGMEATRILRNEHRFDGLPIIAMTAHAMKSDVAKSLAVGMQDHLTKPIDPELLRSTLFKWGIKRT